MVAQSYKLQSSQSGIYELTLQRLKQEDQKKQQILAEQKEQEEQLREQAENEETISSAEQPNLIKAQQ